MFHTALSSCPKGVQVKRVVRLYYIYTVCKVMLYIPLSSLSIVWMFIPNFTLCSVECYTFSGTIVMPFITPNTVSSVDVFFISTTVKHYYYPHYA